MDGIQALIEVFAESRRLVALEGNDFSWSGWEDADEALAEIDAILEVLRQGRSPGASTNVLFLPTGPLQELSLSSGWGNEFVALADRFDRAIEQLGRERTAAPPIEKDGVSTCESGGGSEE